MRAVMVQVPEHFLEERRRLGHDRRGEMGEGVLHLVPPPNADHGIGTHRLARALG